MIKNNNHEILSIYLKEIDRYKLLDRDEEKSYAIRAKNGDKDARKKLIESNLRFVVSVAKKFQGNGLPLEDLISEGNIGLMDSIKKYEPGKGYHFVTYAVWWIRQKILKAIIEQPKTVRVPVNKRVSIKKINRTYDALVNAHNKTPTMEEIAEAVGIPYEQFREIEELDQISSLDAYEKEPPLSSLNGCDYKSPDEEATDNVLGEEIKSAFEHAHLSDKEKIILEQRFGLNGKGEHALAEIGLKFNLTKERIRQIEKKAIDRLKDDSYMNKLVSN
ncbi:MAG: RNA polymerase sigma factor RpoD/SigA [Candidatus Nanoarchaeia archaeon]|nr:RNA polymerase sigma factor RpoD/SigA [Candidatus Nanoarchaeia archaeon]MDD5357873.1 RNA polymerase sigma factor RpoD/SigA [Candidatus Nanoarchaeia archaeon]MDD5588792.1 RNA polymerase sigma factor RpoD/SigA [Candidatus Nanoarchaeia archaeon]